MKKSNLQVVDPTKDGSWDEMLSSWSDATIFHTSMWARTLASSYGYKCIYVCDPDRTQLIVPMMEVRSWLTGNRAISLPFTDTCQILLRPSGTIQPFLDYLKNLAMESRWKYIEFRSGQWPYGEIPHSSYFYVHELELTKGVDQLFKGLRSSTKRNIKKAIKQGVEIQHSTSFDSLKEFYRLNCITRKRHGLPPQPFQFFKNLFKNVIEKGHGVFVMAKYESRVIASAFFMHFGERAIYKYGASSMELQHLRPNNLIMWEAISYFAQKGCKYFHFGRTEPENKGLLQFKRGWRPEEKIFYYYKYDVGKRDFVKASSLGSGQSLTNKIFSKMPISVLRLIGEVLYPHVA